MRGIAGLLFVCSLSCSAGAQLTRNLNGDDATLKAAHLSAQIRNDIVAAIEKKFTDQPKESPSGRQIALSSWVSFVRLGQTGPPAILIKSGPDDPNNGATGNGEFWLFRRHGNHAVLILEAGGYSLAPKRHAYHAGYLDVETAWNMSCCEGNLEDYRFNGSRYLPAFCYSYTVNEGGNTKLGKHERCSQ